jgi:hypothetical protein
MKGAEAKKAVSAERVGVSRAAAMLGLCENSIRRLVAEGKLVCEKTDKGHRSFSAEYIAAEAARRA